MLQLAAHQIRSCNGDWRKLRELTFEPFVDPFAIEAANLITYRELDQYLTATIIIDEWVDAEWDARFL